MTDIQEAIEYFDSRYFGKDYIIDHGKTLAAAYRDMVTKCNRLHKIAQELYNALYYQEGKLEALDLWEEYLL